MSVRGRQLARWKDLREQNRARKKKRTQVKLFLATLGGLSFIGFTFWWVR